MMVIFNSDDDTDEKGGGVEFSWWFSGLDW